MMESRKRNTTYLYVVIWATLLIDVLEGRLVISPGATQYKEVNTGVIFTCSIPGYEYGGGDLPNIRWKNVVGQFITSSSGRSYTEIDGMSSLKLYITRIYEGDAGLYTCLYEHNGQTEFADVRLSLYEKIKFHDTQALIRSPVTSGATPLLPCLATGQPKPLISWRFKGKKLPNGKNNNDPKYRYETGGLRIFNLSAADNGTYECRAEEFIQGKFSTKPVVLDVLYKPIIHGGLTSQVAVEGQTVNIKCEATGNPAITYEWSRGQKMSDMVTIKVRLQGNTDTYTIKNMMKTDMGRYFCRVENSLGYAESFADIDIQIPPAIKVVREKPVVEGMTVYVLCEATGDPAPTITWMKEGNQEEYVEGTQPEDNNIQINTNQGGLSKLTFFATKRSYQGTYICIARNSAGETRNSVKVTVHYYPTANISQTEILGWPEQVRNVTCTGHGQPLPTINWFRDKQYISDSNHYQVDTISKDKMVVSTLTISIGKESWIYDDYKCTVKNKIGFKTQIVRLNKAELPGMPKNIKVEYTSDDSILLTSDFPVKNGTFPITGWKIEYDSTEHVQSGVQFYDLGESLKLTGLRPATQYVISLSCGSKIGYGPPTKFEVKTPEEVQADIPILMEEKEEVESTDNKKPSTNTTFINSNRGNMKVEGVKVEESQEAANGSYTVWVAGGIAAIVIIIILVVIVCFIQKKKRRAGGLYIGRKQVEYGTNMYSSPAGVDVDNMQLTDIRIKVNPLPDLVHPDKIKSPMEGRKSTPKSKNRSVDSNLVNLDGKTPTIQKHAWEQMKLRQDEFISDEEDEFLDDENSELPLPPPFLLNGSDEHIINHSPRDVDSESYQDIIEGYHSGDNMDDVEEAEFELRVPSDYGQNTYISYDPVT